MSPRKPPAAGPYVTAMRGYVADVLSGAVPACKWVRLACERHERDVARSRSKDFPFRFDEKSAERMCRFVAMLPHVKGRWAAGVPKPIRPEPWQCFFFGSLFGWLNKATGKRRFRKGRLYVPRKNGKSVVGAATGLYMFAVDGEPGAEVYSGATTEKQAWEVFGPAREMTRKTLDFREHFAIEVNAKSLVRVGDLSKFEPVIGKPGDGASPHCSITDEYHEHATDDQLSTFETGMGAREQPLSLVISTSGDNLAGPCRDDWLECQKILERVIEDERTFALIYTMDDDDDWTSEAALRKANPNYDVSVSAEFLMAQQAEAINNPRKQGHFKTKHLNIWVQAREAYINMQRWAQCCSPKFTLEDFEGAECFVGLDLASKIDLAAIELLFPQPNGAFFRFGIYYLPESTVELPSNQHYRAWRDLGLLTVTDGNIIDFRRIKEDLIELCSRFTVRNVAYDPHQATMLVSELMDAGVPVIEFRPTVLNFSEPMKQVDALIRDLRLRHNGDQVMTWAMSNVVARQDAKDNVYPRKEREENKIDPFVALVMAMGVAMRDDGSADLSDFLNEPVM
jgi:phage terminase large subunit-like protein